MWLSPGGVVEPGAALRAGHVDLAWINGHSFPAYRGGPIYWGMRQGLWRVVVLATQLGAELGPRWQPARLLEHLSETGGSWREAGY